MKTQSRLIPKWISQLLLLVALLPASAGLGILGSLRAASLEEPGENRELYEAEDEMDSPRREEAREQELTNLKTLLQSRGITMTKEGIRAYLQDLTAPASDRAVAQKMIRQLGSADFAERWRAEQALKKLPVSEFDLLQDAARSPDPEVALRAKGILEGASSRRRQSVETATRAMRAIEILKLSGLTEEIFGTADLFRDEYLVASIQRALLVTVTAEDLALLESLIGDKPSLRTIAIRTLGAKRLAGVGGVRERLDALWNTGEPADRLASTEAFLARGESEALGRFVRLLESDDIEIRIRAASRLWGATGQPIAFNPLAPVEERAKQVAAWQTWIAESGSTAALRTDLVYTCTRGLTLVANPLNDSVVEYDLSGMEAWRVEQERASASWGIETGERFVHGGGELIVYAPGQGPPRVLWSVEDVNKVRPLPFGETLLWSYKDGALRQVDRAGKLIWETEVKWEGKKWIVTDIQRLPDGRTLVAIDTSGKTGPVYGDTVLELDRDGRVVREFPYDTKVEVFQQLPNGNALVRLDPAHPSCGSVVQERDPAGRAVWSYDTGNFLRAAHRLPNGNTLLGGDCGVKEIRPDGSTAWTLKTKIMTFGTSMVYRY